MIYSTTQNNFSQGYLDPLLHGLAGTDTYNYGLKNCKNFIPDSRGFLFRRPGTKYYGISIKSSKAKIRAVRSVDSILTVVFSDHAINILYDGNPIFSMESPYSSDDLDDLNIAINDSELYLVHPRVRPYKLGVVSKVGMRIGELVDKGDAEYEHKNPDEDKMTLDDIVISGIWSLTPLEFTGSVEFASEGFYPSCQAFKGGRWYLSGSRMEPGIIYASRPISADGTTRFTDFTMEEKYLITTKHVLTRQVDYVSAGSEEIASVDYRTEDENTSEDYDPTEAVPDPVSETSFKMYKLTDSGYEETTLEEERIRTIETTTQVTYQVQASQQPDHAIKLVEMDMHGSEYKWLFSQQRLLAGARRSIWMDTGVAATPSDFDMSNTLACSNSNIQPCAYSNYVFFVTADRRHVRAIYFDNDSGGYRLIEVSQKAVSLFTSNIKEIQVSEGLVDILWVLLEDGRLLSCTLSGATFGWAEHELGGEAKIQSIYSYTEEDEADILFLVVDRGHTDEDGGKILYVETLEFEDLVHSLYFNFLDGAIEKQLQTGETNIDLSDVNEHEFLSGDSLQLVADNWPQSRFKYKTSVKVEKPNAKKIFIGFPYESSVELLRPEYNSSETGMSLGKKRRAIESKALLYRSACGVFEYDDNEGDMKSLEFQQLIRGGATVTDDDAAFFTGLVFLNLRSYISSSGFIRIRADKPLPLTIQAVITKWDLQEV